MTPMELAEIEARANAATPGPWEVGVLRRECDHPTTNQFTEERSVFPPLGESGPVALAAEGEHENGAFIAHARTDVPALIAEVKRLRAENDVLRKSADRRRVRCQCGARRGQGHALACPVVMERW